MRPPVLRLTLDEMIVDNFAGGGGASTGIKMATGRDPDIAVNHDPEALAIYRANHEGTRVMCEDVFDVKPRFVVGNRKVGLAWFSPDCTFFSKARGAKPHRDRNKARRRRGLAGVVLKWAAQVRPRVIFVENVEEFKEWGPLDDEGRPDPERKGQSFKRWKKRLENLGYRVECSELRACDYGAPTSRKRLFIIARCDGEAIAWPEKTHGPDAELPYRTAAECIDWSIPCPSIFTRKRPLAVATLRRIARGIKRYVIDAAEPFIVPVKTWGGGGNEPRSLNQPFRTVTASKRGEYAIVSPTLVVTGNGEREGQAPRANDIQAPMRTVTATGSQGALVAAFLAKHYGGHETPGAPMHLPMSTITTQDHHHLVSSTIVKFKGTCKDGQPVTEPLATVQAQGLHYAEVRAFLVAYYGTEKDGGALSEPARTVTTKDRFGLVTVHGVDYAIVDIGMRMLTPRELFNAQGFPREYVIDPIIGGKPLTKTEQVHKCGNAVPPPFSEALVRAQFQDKPAANVA